MAPRTERHPARALVGLGFFGDPFHSHGGWTEDNEIGRLWQRLYGHLASPDCRYPFPTVSYEVHIRHDVTPETGEFEIFVGFEVPPGHEAPVELCVKHLPAVEYRVFTVGGDDLGTDDCDLELRLSSMGFELPCPFQVQRYDERFCGLDQLAESELDILIPVRDLTAYRTAEHDERH